MPSATQRRNGSAPESAAVETAAPESAAVEQEAPAAPALDIAAAVEQEDITKRVSVFVDVNGVQRAPTDTGTLAAVQRELRADGTLGEYMLCEVRPPKEKGAPESVQRYSVAAIQRLKSALDSAGVKTIR